MCFWLDDTTPRDNCNAARSLRVNREGIIEKISSQLCCGVVDYDPYTMRLSPKKLEIIFEFLVFGIVIGVFEDLIAITLTTDATIDIRTIVIVVAIAIPFAIIGEVFADNIDFVKLWNRLRGRQESKD